MLPVDDEENTESVDEYTGGSSSDLPAHSFFFALFNNRSFILILMGEKSLLDREKVEG